MSRGIVEGSNWSDLHTHEAIRYSIGCNLLLPSAAVTSMRQRSRRSPCNQSNSTPSLRAASQRTHPMSLVNSISVSRLASRAAGKRLRRDRDRSAGTTDRLVTLIWDMTIPSMTATGPRRNAVRSLPENERIGIEGRSAAYRRRASRRRRRAAGSRASVNGERRKSPCREVLRHDRADDDSEFCTQQRGFE